MKARELMLYDWVRIKKGMCAGCLNQLTEVHELECASSYEPIPLTEAILKANGFARNPLLKSWIIDGELELIEDSMGNTKLEYWFSVSDQYVCPIHHVHELQHALRLCGLSDIADNFKIE